MKGGEKQAETHKLFMKIMPPDDVHKNIMSNGFMDVTEIESYKKLFKGIYYMGVHQLPHLKCLVDFSYNHIFFLFFS